MENKFDTIVLGLGAMGSAAVYQLAKRGNKVLGIDQFSPPHTYGSSHGDTRITRQAIGEGEEYVPLVFRSHEIWRELEKESDTNLLTITGGLILESQNSKAATHGRFNFLQRTIDTAKKYNISHSVLSTADIKQRFPQFNIITDEIGYFEDNSGYLIPEKCVEVQLDLAEKHGAHIRRKEKILQITPSINNHGVKIKTNQRIYEAEKIILSVGPWINQFLEPQYGKFFKIHRQVMYWFKVEEVKKFLPPTFPIFIWIFEKGGEYGFYGFPSTDNKTIKMASEQFEIITDPENVDRSVSGEEKNQMYRNYVNNRLFNVTNNCKEAVTCLYTTTPDSNFVIDFHPHHPQIIIASPCSGHGFKHSAAIGETLAELIIDGRSKINISSFKLARLL